MHSAKQFRHGFRHIRISCLRLQGLCSHEAGHPEFRTSGNAGDGSLIHIGTFAAVGFLIIHGGAHVASSPIGFRRITLCICRLPRSCFRRIFAVTSLVLASLVRGFIHPQTNITGFHSFASGAAVGIHRVILTISAGFHGVTPLGASMGLSGLWPHAPLMRGFDHKHKWLLMRVFKCSIFELILQGGQDGLICFFFSRLIIRTSTGCISGVLSARAVLNVEIIACELFCPTNLSAIQFFGGHKVAKIGVITQNTHGELASLQIVAPSFEAFHDCE